MKRTFGNFPGSRRVRRHSHWAFMLSTTLAASATVAANPMASSEPAGNQSGKQNAGSGAGDTRVLQFNIPAGPLDAAIAEYRRVTGLIVILANPAIGLVQSPGASGALTASRAMDAMLAGTSVRATFAPDAVSLDIRGVTESVAVEGRAPKVNSPKYTQPLLNTPQTVVVIPQTVYQEQAATSLREVLRNTPGITLSIGEGGSGGTSSGDNVLIRGFSARNDIYVDGARDVGLVNRDAFNTEMVEVAKGPSSVTGGRGATGGSINLVTKAPSLGDAATVRLTGGSASNGRATFDVNRTLNKSVAFRLNGMWQDTGYPGRDVAKYKSWGFAPSLAMGLGTPTQLTLNFSHLQQNNIPDWGIPTLLPDTAIARGITVNDLNFSNFYGIASRDYEITKSDMATATVDHKFSRTLSLRNLTRYGKNYRDATLTPPRPATSVAGQGPEDPGYNPLVPQIRRTDTKYQHRDDSVVTNQTDLTSSFKTGPFRHTVDVGMELAHDHQPTYAFTDSFANGRPPVDDLFNPTPFVAYTPSYVRTGASSEAHADSAAAYAFDTVKLNDRWQVDLGARWDRVAVDYTTVAASTAAVPNGALATFGRTDKAVSGRTGLVYKPVARGSIYAAYSTSFTPSFDGTLGLTLAATGVNSQALPPEKTHNLEVGTKWELAHNLQFTAAAFDTEKTNAKTTDLNGATVLAGDQDVKGVEFGLSGNLTERWGAFGGLSLMNGTVKNSLINTEIGAQLPYVPKASFNLWTTYRFPMGLTLGGGTNYSDGNYFNQTGGFLFVSGGTVPNPKYVQNAAAVQALTKYWLFNAVAMYQVNSHLQLQVNGTNLGNERYADRAYDRHFLPGPARAVVFSPVITF
jgi:catecholate siderophore receptor